MKTTVKCCDITRSAVAAQFDTWHTCMHVPGEIYSRWEGATPDLKIVLACGWPAETKYGKVHDPRDLTKYPQKTSSSNSLSVRRLKLRPQSARIVASFFFFKCYVNISAGIVTLCLRINLMTFWLRTILHYLRESYALMFANLMSQCLRIILFTMFPGGSTDSVIVMHKIEEDSRLLARLSALEMPILVSTLLAGFSLVMFEIASTDLARQLTVLAFALESSASIVLSLIGFRGQQLYSYATDLNPLTRKFLRRVRPVTVVALLGFSLGVVAFVLAFVLEASEELGGSWLGVVALFFAPTLAAGVLFAVSTVQVKRYSLPTAPFRSE